jgi:hypothetical protein
MSSIFGLCTPVATLAKLILLLWNSLMHVSICRFSQSSLERTSNQVVASSHNRERT